MEEQPIDAAAFNAFEAAGWSEIGDAYDRFFGPITSRVIEPLLDAAGVGAGTRLLDVATGPGYVAGAALTRDAAVTAVDVAEPMVRLAQQRYPHLDARVGDAEDLPLPDATFDAVVANFVVLHLGQPERAAAECARVLAPAGRAALSMWDAPAQARLFGVILEAIAATGAQAPPDIPAGPPFFRFADDEEFAHLLAGAGFEAIEVQTIAFTHRTTAAAIWDGFVGGTARTRWLVLGQPEEVQHRIRAELEQRLAEYGGPDAVAIPVSVKIASGRLPGGEA